MGWWDDVFVMLSKRGGMINCVPWQPWPPLPTICKGFPGAWIERSFFSRKQMCFTRGIEIEKTEKSTDSFVACKVWRSKRHTNPGDLAVWLYHTNHVPCRFWCPQTQGYIFFFDGTSKRHTNPSVALNHPRRHSGAVHIGPRTLRPKRPSFSAHWILVWAVTYLQQVGQNRSMHIYIYIYKINIYIYIYIYWLYNLVMFLWFVVSITLHTCHSFDVQCSNEPALSMATHWHLTPIAVFACPLIMEVGSA